MNAWVLRIAQRRKYWGNEGYDNDPASHYSFDTNTANSTQIASGDIVLIREGDLLTGVSEIEAIDSKPVVKKFTVCPECGAKRPDMRTTLKPAWKCRKDPSHEFDEPLYEEAQVTDYVAHFGANYRALKVPVKWQPVRSFFYSRSNHSIRKLKYEALLSRKPEGLGEVLQLLNSIVEQKEEGNIGGAQEHATEAEKEAQSGFQEAQAVYASGWTGRPDQVELAEKLIAFAPVAIEGLAEWLEFLKKRNDPDPPEGLPEDLIENLELMHGHLSFLLQCARSSKALEPDAYDAVKKISETYLRPVWDGSRLLISGVPLWGSRMFAGLASLKAFEFIGNTTIPISSGTAAGYVAAGVAAATFATRKRKRK